MNISLSSVHFSARSQFDVKARINCVPKFWKTSRYCQYEVCSTYTTLPLFLFVWGSMNYKLCLGSNLENSELNFSQVKVGDALSVSVFHFSGFSIIVDVWNVLEFHFCGFSTNVDGS